MMSGRPLKSFRQGWALAGMGFPVPKKAHYFTRDGLAEARSTCGRMTAPAGALLEEGSWTRCAVCQAKHPDPLEAGSVFTTRPADSLKLQGWKPGVQGSIVGIVRKAGVEMWAVLDVVERGDTCELVVRKSAAL